MRERPRLLEGPLARALREFPVVAVVGLRQVGKTTLVRRAGRGRAFVTLDDLGALEAARRDPAGFVASLPRPVTIDEVQRAPEILLPLKREVDRERRPGAFLLTGSARPDTRRGVSETLAGRVALLRLRPLTWAEAAGRADGNAADALFACGSARDVAERFAPAPPLDAARTLAGGLPLPLLSRRGGARARWFDHYRAAYVEGDVPPFVRLEDVPAFLRFLTLAALRTGQTANFAALAHETGIAADTGLRWFGVLEATFLVDRLPPWWRNLGKRLVKAPKLHFGDAGLAAHLAGVRTGADAVRQNLAGALLETLTAQHLLAYAESARVPTALYHYRTHAGAEVDFVLARGPRLIPLEVKLSATVRPAEARGLRAFLSDFRDQARFGVILYAGADPVPIDRQIVAVPLSAVLESPPRPTAR